MVNLIFNRTSNSSSSTHIDTVLVGSAMKYNGWLYTSVMDDTGQGGKCAEAFPPHLYTINSLRYYRHSVSKLNITQRCLVLFLSSMYDDYIYLQTLLTGRQRKLRRQWFHCCFVGCPPSNGLFHFQSQSGERQLHEVNLSATRNKNDALTPKAITFRDNVIRFK